MTDTAVATHTPAAPELNIAWMSNGVPLVIGGGQEAIDQMRAQGFQIFYMLTELKHLIKDEKSTVTKTVKTTRLVKVVANIVGNAIVEVETDSSLTLKDIKSEAKFLLPKLPWELVYEVDTLFRRVHDKNKTEAIILWTYDTKFLDSDTPTKGWGYLVPEQTNTGGSCKYDPQSIVDEKDDLGDTIMIVGSAHSHPSMPAYASHTDEADQGAFDGLHMTYGWPPGSKQTTFHIELQMGGGRFIYTPEMIFADMPAIEVDEDMEKIIDARVKKVSYQGQVNPKGSSVWTPKSSYTGGQDYSPGYSGSSSTSWDKNLPKGCPDPRQVTLVRKVLLSEAELTKCPVCDVQLFPYDKKGGGGKCWQCQSFYLAVGVTLEDLMQTRERHNKPNHEIDFTGDNKPDRSVWVWEEALVDGKNGIFDQIRPLWLTEADKKKDDGPLGLGKCTGCQNIVDSVVDGACGACDEPLKEQVNRGKAQKVTPKELPQTAGKSTTNTTDHGGTGTDASGK